MLSFYSHVIYQSITNPVTGYGLRFLEYYQRRLIERFGKITEQLHRSEPVGNYMVLCSCYLCYISL